MTRKSTHQTEWFCAFPIPSGFHRTFILSVFLALFLHPISLRACSACYGASDSPMAKGMNAGIFSLLGVVVVVLGSIGGFFIYLAKKSADPAQPVISND